MVQHKNSNPVYRLTIGSMVNGLRNTAEIMDKAERHAVEHEIPLENLLQSRLFPDMFNLLQQIQYICYLAADFARHFSDAPAPRVGYDETTWAELRMSLATATDYLQAIAPQRVLEQADKIVPTFMDDSRGMTAVDYAADVIMPDFHFHMVVAYALLRHNGVRLGKSDFLGEMTTVELAKSSP
jgi:hypothetical protein